MNAVSAARVVGLVVGLYGAIAAVNWRLRAEVLARLIPDLQHMGIVNPLLFVAIGICFFAASRHRQPRGRLARASAVCIAPLIALPLGYLFESATGIALGIDIVRDGTVATAANSHPGRLSPDTSLAILLAGIAFWVLRRPPTQAHRLIFLTLVLAVTALGLGALVGYLVGLETLYQVANFNRMLPTTAVAVTVVGAGLWMIYDASPDFDAQDLRSNERRIRRRSIAVITLVALAGGVAGFSVMRDTVRLALPRWESALALPMSVHLESGSVLYGPTLPIRHAYFPNDCSLHH